MKRYFSLFLFLIVFMPVPFAQSQVAPPTAEEEDAWTALMDEGDTAQAEEDAPAKAPPAARSGASLVDLNMGRDESLVRGTGVKSDIDELERRVTYLERDIRFMEDRIRSQDRSIDDLRRRLRTS